MCRVSSFLVTIHGTPKCSLIKESIIAVPGLGSDMTYTWVSKGVHWLRDESMLQKTIPKARVSVFGYRSQWYGKDAVEIRLSTISRDLLDAIKMNRRESVRQPLNIFGCGSRTDSCSTENQKQTHYLYWT